MEVLNRPALEAEFRAKFAALNERHRREVIRIMGDPPDTRRIPPQFWADVERDNQTALFLLLMSVFAQSAFEHTLRAGGVHPGDVEALRRAVEEANGNGPGGRPPQTLQGAVGGFAGGRRTGDGFDPGTGSRTVTTPSDPFPVGPGGSGETGGRGGRFSGPAGAMLTMAFGNALANAVGRSLGVNSGIPESSIPKAVILPQDVMAGSGLNMAAKQFAIPMAKELGQKITDTGVKRLAGKEGIDALTAADGVFGPGRSDGIVTNEFTRAVSAGGEWTVRRLGLVSDADVWRTRPSLSQTGPCQICEPLDGTTRLFWGRVFPLGPPEPHPQCVCEIEYNALLN